MASADTLPSQQAATDVSALARYCRGSRNDENSTAIGHAGTVHSVASEDKDVGSRLSLVGVHSDGQYEKKRVSPSSHGNEFDKERLERSGRGRPPALLCLGRELAFVGCLSMSQVLQEYFTEGFIVLLPTLTDSLHMSPRSVTWSASVFSLVVSSFLLTFGRAVDAYGGLPVYLLGLAWLSVWTFVAAFSRTSLLLIVCRAMQGLGAAAYLPASLDMLGRIYLPGSRKNIVFSIYGAMAPVGSGLGIIISGLVSHYGAWSWYFWIGGALAVVTVLASYISLSIPTTKHREMMQMDWWGSIAIPISLTLLVFTVTDIAHAPDGWRTIYIYVTGFLALVTAFATFYVEGWLAKEPLIPFALFKRKYIRPFALGLVLSYGTVGIYVLYATLYIRNVMMVDSVRLIAWFTPMFAGGLILAMIGGRLMHVISGTVVLLLSGLAVVVASLLLALVPPNASYWVWILPAMLSATLAIDWAFTVANVFLSSVLPARQQGLAGSFANVLVQLSIALLLGAADIVATVTSQQGQAQSYKNVFWFELACGTSALVVFAGFVRIRKAESGLPLQERNTPSQSLRDRQRAESLVNDKKSYLLSASVESAGRVSSV